VAEIRWLEFHSLVELSLTHLLLHELVNVHLHVDLFCWFFFHGSICSIPLPTSLLLIVIFLISVNIGAVEAVAELPTLDTSLVTEAILFEALRFFAGTVDEVTNVGLVAMDLFEVVNIFDVLFFDSS
jgi:hypothetical protein